MIYAAATVGLIAGAALALAPASGALAAPSGLRRTLLQPTPPKGGDDGNEGDEGNEGLDRFVFPSGGEGNEGDEGNEGNEGDEGDGSTKGSTISSVTCTSQATAETFSDMSDAHATAVAEVFTEFCRPDFDGVLEQAVELANDSGFAIAEALAAAQAVCISQGNAFGCASASATAMAWAEATAEAHATAVASSFEQCDCLVDAASLSVGSASTFIELVAKAFARAEVVACVEGDDFAFASAYARCSAASYATVFATAIAEALLEGDCFSAIVATRIVAETGAVFEVVEGCERDDFSIGDAFGDTSGSTAEGQAKEI